MPIAPEPDLADLRKELQTTTDVSECLALHPGSRGRVAAAECKVTLAFTADQ